MDEWSTVRTRTWITEQKTKSVRVGAGALNWGGGYGTGGGESKRAREIEKEQGREIETALT